MQIVVIELNKFLEAWEHLNRRLVHIDRTVADGIRWSFGKDTICVAGWGLRCSALTLLPPARRARSKTRLDSDFYAGVPAPVILPCRIITWYMLLHAA